MFVIHKGTISSVLNNFVKILLTVHYVWLSVRLTYQVILCHNINPKYKMIHTDMIILCMSIMYKNIYNIHWKSTYNINMTTW